MNRWDERSIKDDFNRASKAQEAEEKEQAPPGKSPETIKEDFNAAAKGNGEKPDEPEEPELNYDPPKPAGPGPGGAAPAWDRHRANHATNTSPSKDGSDKPKPGLSETFNKNAQRK